MLWSWTRVKFGVFGVVFGLWVSTSFYPHIYRLFSLCPVRCPVLCPVYYRRTTVVLLPLQRCASLRIPCCVTASALCHFFLDIISKSCYSVVSCVLSCIMSCTLSLGTYAYHDLKSAILVSTKQRKGNQLINSIKVLTFSQA